MGKLGKEIVNGLRGMIRFMSEKLGYHYNFISFNNVMSLECRLLRPIDLEALELFFISVIKARDDRFFHPHGFGRDDADRVCHYRGDDKYYAMFSENKIIAYGMLRGWDDGYEVPSLGIIIGRDARGLGLGRTFMLFLHSAAKMSGAKSIRLKVHKDNDRAIFLYESLGYVLKKFGDEYIGILEL
jgi:ribosomal protein S18 acetylase RimI-like enzyme